MLELNLPQSLYRQEEQKWLDALEKGELDDFGRVKQDKDVSMMTARQVQYDSYQLQNSHLCFSCIIPLVKRRKCCLIWRISFLFHGLGALSSSEACFVLPSLCWQFRGQVEEITETCWECLKGEKEKSNFSGDNVRMLFCLYFLREPCLGMKQRVKINFQSFQQVFEIIDLPIREFLINKYFHINHAQLMLTVEA